MTLTYTYDGSPLGFPIPPTKLNLPNRAEIGSVDVGGVSPEDTAAALTLQGFGLSHDCAPKVRGS